MSPMLLPNRQRPSANGAVCVRFSNAWVQRPSPIADGSPYPPDKLSRDWGHAVRDRKLPSTNFHGLGHSPASARIAAGLDVVTVRRPLGDVAAAITLPASSH